MRDEKAFEEAMIALQNAVDSRGLRINLLPRSPNAQGFLERIHWLSDGIPMELGAAIDDGLGHQLIPTGTPELYANIADNLILLAKAMRASIRGLK